MRQMLKVDAFREEATDPQVGDMNMTDGGERGLARREGGEHKT